MRMQAVREMRKHMSLNKALAYCRVSKRVWYYTGRPRDVPIDADTARKVREAASKCPTCGTGRMAAR